MTDDIRREAERQLAQLRAARGLEAGPPHTPGRRFPLTRGVLLAEHDPAPVPPVPLEAWAAANPDDEAPPGDARRGLLVVPPDEVLASTPAPREQAQSPAPDVRPLSGCSGAQTCP